MRDNHPPEVPSVCFGKQVANALTTEEVRQILNKPCDQTKVGVMMLILCSVDINMLPKLIFLLDSTPPRPLSTRLLMQPSLA